MPGKTPRKPSINVSKRGVRMGIKIGGSVFFFIAVVSFIFFLRYRFRDRLLVPFLYFLKLIF